MNQTKYLYIVRHGHSGFDAKTDKSRILTNKGQQVVSLTADYINNKSVEYDLTLEEVISSDAVRTQQTAEIICRHLNIKKLNTDSNLYSTIASQWINKIVNSHSNTLVLVGHNPTLSELVNRLTGNQCYMNPANCAFVKLNIKNNEIVFPAELLGYFNNE